MSKLLFNKLLLRRVVNLEQSLIRSELNKCFLPVKIPMKVNASRLSQSTVRPIQQKTDVLDVKINYELLGTGSHPVVCIPGALGSIESDYGPLLKRMSLDKFTVVVLELPGYGKSRPHERDFSGGIRDVLFRDVKYVDGLMQKLGFPKYSVLGWSNGAISAILLASSIQSSLKKLVIWGAFSNYTERDLTMSPALSDITKWSANVRDPMVAMYGHDCVQKYWTALGDAFKLTYKNKWDICSEDLPKVKCPTLVFQGLKDVLVHPEHAENIHKGIQSSEFYSMKDGKHNLHLRFADEFLSVTEKFLLK